jgi:tight adherence protein B
MSMGLIIVAAAVLILLGGAVWFYSVAQGQERTEEAMTRLRTQSEGAALPATDSPEMSIPGVRRISRLLWRAGSDVQPRTIVIFLAALIVVILLLILMAGPVVGVPITAVLLLIIYLVLIQRAARRRSKIIEQLPGFLENLMRVMSAGNSLEEGLASAAKESTGPIRPLFMSVNRQIKLGAPVDQVLNQAGEIYNLRDLRILSLAANVNRRYGGSLRGVLKSLIAAIRQRGTSARELQAMTAETRMSAVVLALVPLGLTAFLLFRNPHFYDAMWGTSGGRMTLIGAGVWQLIGMFILWRMVNSIGDED